MSSRVVDLGLRLMVVALVAALGLGLTYAVTKDRIEEQKRKEEAEACVSALPSLKDPEELKEEKELEEEVKKHIPDVQKVFSCPTGDIIIVKAKGFGGPIRMAVGIGGDGEIEGLAVISHTETPGLGANVENDRFLEQFVGLADKSRVRVDGEIKAITGATITSKAAAKEVREALEAYQEIKELE